ncbi:MAG: porin [Verrucomicrobia bacterium]|nr:porin [Verrucomicrobiota bacterium]
MKTNLKLTLILACLLPAASGLQAGTETYDSKSVTRPPETEIFGTGPYISLQAGVNAFQEYGRSRHYQLAEGDFAIRRDSRVGGFGGLKAGYVFGTGLIRPTVEADLFYNGFRTRYREKLNGNTIARFNEDVNSGAFMANFILKIAPPSWPRLQPYAGVGVGAWVMGDNEVTWTGPTPSFPIRRQGKDSGFAWQVIGGGDYYLNRRWSVYGEYKFLNYEDAAPVGPQRAIRQHLAGVGVRFHF